MPILGARTVLPLPAESHDEILESEQTDTGKKDADKQRRINNELTRIYTRKACGRKVIAFFSGTMGGGSIERTVYAFTHGYKKGIEAFQQLLLRRI